MKNLRDKPRFLMIIATIFFCAVAGFLHFLLFKIHFFAISADESGRTLDAYQWASTNRQLSDVWLPFSAIEIGSILKLWKDLFVVPRIICVFWGMCTLGAVGLYSFELFHDEKVTILSLLLACFFPPLLVLAHVPLYEITFIFFVVLSMYFYLRWQKTEQSVSLIFSAFCLAVSSTIRYEGWAFVLIFTAQLMWLFIQPKEGSGLKRRTVLLTAALISLSFSIFWIIQTALTTESPVSFIGKTSNDFLQATHASLLRLLWLNVGTQFIVQCIFTFNILGIVSAAILWKNQPRIRHILFIALLALICMVFMSFIARTMPTHNPWRIAVVWSCLLLPFTAHMLINYFRQTRGQHLILRKIIPLLIIIAFCLQMVRILKYSSFTEDDYNAGKLLNTRISESQVDSEKILIETSSWNYIHVLISSQHPEYFLYNSGSHPKFPKEFIISPLKPVERTILENHRIRYLVFRSEIYKNALERADGFIKESECGDWTIYRLMERQ